jgi:hypothetical protein
MITYFLIFGGFMLLSWLVIRITCHFAVLHYDLYGKKKLIQKRTLKPLNFSIITHKPDHGTFQFSPAFFFTIRHPSVFDDSELWNLDLCHPVFNHFR